MEVAPGVWVAELSEGGGIGPGGDVRTFGARIAVWHTGEDGTGVSNEHEGETDG